MPQLPEESRRRAGIGAVARHRLRGGRGRGRAEAVDPRQHPVGERRRRQETERLAHPALPRLPKSKEFAKLLPGLAKVAGTLKPKAEGDKVTLALDEPQVAALLRPLFGLTVRRAGATGR